MERFGFIVEKYTAAGVKYDNVEYAIESVKDGSKREHIVDNLTADYRGMKYDEANMLVSELYAANGGEFKKENKDGYLFGFFILVFLGLPCTFYIGYVLLFGGVLVRPIAVGIGALAGILGGLRLILLSAKGKYRDSMNPFKD